MAPVYLTLREFFEVDFIATGQHREMFYQGLSPFGIKPTVDLMIMEESQSLESVLSKSVTGLSTLFKEQKYDLVLVHVIPQLRLAVLWQASITEFHAHMWKPGYALVT